MNDLPRRLRSDYNINYLLDKQQEPPGIRADDRTTPAMRRTSSAILHYPAKTPLRARSREALSLSLTWHIMKTHIVWCQERDAGITSTKLSSDKVGGTT